MTFPQWNSEWEKPDPLRGARGWCLHHYVAVGAAAVLLVTTAGVVVPGILKARQRGQELDRLHRQVQEVLAGVTNSPGDRGHRE